MPEDVNYPFSQIPIPERQSKPRSKGLTMMIDWGLPPGLQRDCIETQGLYVDDAKIAAGIPRVMPADLLKKKIELFRIKKSPAFREDCLPSWPLLRATTTIFWKRDKDGFGA